LPEAELQGRRLALADAQLTLAREHGFESWPAFLKHITAVAAVTGDAAAHDAPLRDVDLYRAVGGMESCRALAAAFYGRVGRDPVLRPLFPASHHRVETFTSFLAQFLGGPQEYSAGRWWLSLRGSHHRFAIGWRERDAWMRNMLEALSDVGIEEPALGALRDFFERSSAHMVNRGDPPNAEAGPADPSPDAFRAEIMRRWEVHLAVEETVAAVRGGDARRALSLAESPVVRAFVAEDRAALVTLLTQMSGSEEPALQDHVRQELLRDPALLNERTTAGRALLHGAAAAGGVATVELLLRLGADPNDSVAVHTPLYYVANECQGGRGAEVVRVLARAGADVNGRDGLKLCTPLHMAARRGSVAIGQALLDCGADIEARDKLGDTPLRRAVNCGKHEMVALLVSRGANIHSRGSRGLTPAQAARTAAMRQLVRGRRRPPEGDD
jgi:truncated hemoglobin YjbI